MDIVQYFELQITLKHYERKPMIVFDAFGMRNQLCISLIKCLFDYFIDIPNWIHGGVAFFCAHSNASHQIEICKSHHKFKKFHNQIQ